MQAVFMVAGKSTRTYPLTLNRPKPLLPIVNRPLIYYNLDQLAGIVDEVILVVGYHKEQFMDLIGNQYGDIKITYQIQEKQLGTGHAVLQVAPLIKDRFIVMNGDDLYTRQDIESLLHYRYAALAKKAPNPELFGVFQINENNEVMNLVEKPKKYIGNLVNVGCYLFETEIFDILKTTPLSERGEIEITSAILRMAKQTPFQVVPLSGYWLPTSFAWDLLKIQKYLFEMKSNNNHKTTNCIIENGTIIDGDVEIGSGSIIRSGAIIHGPVSIGKNCEIGQSTTIGPYTTIGDRTIIHKNSTIEHSILLSNCQIWTNSIIRHSVLGSDIHVKENCKFISEDPENGSIMSQIKGRLQNTNLKYFGGAVGDGVTIGAGTTIHPGCKIWSNVTIPPQSYIQEDLQKVEKYTVTR